jgi:uncharacterized protein
VLDELETIAPVLAVTGDDDYGEVLTDKRVKSQHSLCLEGRTLLLIHCNPFRHALSPHLEKFSSDPVGADAPDILVFGHTHYSIIKKYKGILLVNPGSPFNYSTKLGTVATLRLGPGDAQVEMINLGESGNGTSED